MDHTSLVRALGLIPAHAGKTWGKALQALPFPAHPRSRGENQPSRVTSANPYGSSPLTRGKRARPRAWVACRWLIPAHAGKTRRLQRWPCVPPAHPRSRGENADAVDFPDMAAGSSPLTRGKPLILVSGPGCSGLIPAHAGKTPGAFRGRERQ